MVAKILPVGDLRKSAKNSAIAKTMARRHFAETEAHSSLGAEVPADYALHVIHSWLNRSDNETGTQEKPPRTPLPVDLRFGRIVADHRARSKGCSIAVAA
jgi:hypothetical protein